jgi:hypothetical protein
MLIPPLNVNKLNKVIILFPILCLNLTTKIIINQTNPSPSLLFSTCLPTVNSCKINDHLIYSSSMQRELCNFGFSLMIFSHMTKSHRFVCKEYKLRVVLFFCKTR